MVEFVSPFKNTEFTYDVELSERACYLPHDLVFSVKVYRGQYLHIHKSCIANECECIYFLDGIPTPLKPCRIASAMFKSDMKTEEDRFVLTGTCRGFKVLDGSPNLRYCVKNYRSILQEIPAQKMSITVKKELLNGQVSRVFKTPRCIHALGAIPRPDGRIRPITDCSRPDESINDHMVLTAPRFSYSNIDDTRSLVSPNGFGAVTDISNAYRSVAINPLDRDYLGFTWIVDGHECLFRDNMLCFGLKSAPAIFNALSNFIVRYANCIGVQVIGYLDDFFVASDNAQDCADKQNALIAILKNFGFKVNFDKVSGPSKNQKYLGIIIDLESMVFRLPEGKLSKASDAVSDMLDRSWSSYKKLEKLAGFLAHCSTLVKGGRTFCKRLYGTLKATRGRRRIKLSEVMKQDLKWWQAFLRVFDGTAPIPPPNPPEFEFYTDASGTGFGAWCEDDFLYGYWVKSSPRCHHFLDPPEFTNLSEASINIKELWPVVAAIKRWSSLWSNSRVLLFSDNTQVLAMISTGRSSNYQAMSLIREIFWCVSIYNIDICVSYIPTKENVWADSLSRLPKKFTNLNLYGLPYMFQFCCLHSNPSTA